MLFRFFVLKSDRNSTKFYLICVILVLLSSVIYGVYDNAESGVAHYLVVLLVMASMIGLSCVLNAMTEWQRGALVDVIIISGVLVSLFSLAEFFLMRDMFEVHWKRIGGMRLVSSLLNPNNMGIYIGACLIFLLNARSGMARCMKIVLLLFPFLMSGSRTAWVAFLLTFFVRFIVLDLRKIKVRHVFRFWRGCCWSLFCGYRSTVL